METCSEDHINDQPIYLFNFSAVLVIHPNSFIKRTN